MKQHAWLELSEADTRVRFDWRDFDGDDCYGELFILIRQGATERRFRFGPCSTSCVDKVNRFLQDPQAAETGGGFQNPDIRTFALLRTGAGLRLVVERDNGQVREQVELKAPAVALG